MIVSMRLALITLTVLGCGSKDDYPAVPQALVWHQIPLAPQEGKLEGTGYRIEVPRGAASRPISDNEVELTSNHLKIAVRLEPDDWAFEDPIQQTGLAVASKEVNSDGWVITYDAGRSAFSHRYVDDSALTCNAQATNDGISPEHTQLLLRICKSLVATTPIATPSRYPEGMSPSKMRAGMCTIALDHVASLEPPPKKKSKRKPTAAEVQANADRETARLAQQERCVRERWQPKLLDCLIDAVTIRGAGECGAKL